MQAQPVPTLEGFQLHASVFIFTGFQIKVSLPLWAGYFVPRSALSPSTQVRHRLRAARRESGNALASCLLLSSTARYAGWQSSLCSGPSWHPAMQPETSQRHLSPVLENRCRREGGARCANQKDEQVGSEKVWCSSVGRYRVRRLRHLAVPARGVGCGPWCVWSICLLAGAVGAAGAPSCLRRAGSCGRAGVGPPIHAVPATIDGRHAVRRRPRRARGGAPAACTAHACSGAAAG